MKLPTLYSRTSNGSIQQWTIETKDNQFRTSEGIKDGKITVNSWTTCAGKNIGRANETSPKEQAESEAQSKWQKKIDKGYYENIKKIDDFKFFEPMLAKKYEDYKDEIVWPIYSNVKLDGVRNIVSINGTFSRNGKPVVSVPHFREALQPILDKHPDIVCDGECYSHKLKHNFDQLMSLARQSKPTPEDLAASKEKLEYHIYDCYFAKQPDLTFSERFKLLKDLLKNVKDKAIVLVAADVAKNQEELDTLYRQYLDEGYEGQMIRFDTPYENKRTKNLLKRKEFQEEEFKIVKISDGKGNRSGLASIIEFVDKKGKNFEAGVIGNNDYTADLYKNRAKYVGQKGTVIFQNYTPDGVPRFGKMKIIRNYE